MEPVAAGLFAGFAADLLVGDPRRWHPVSGFGCVAARYERVAWRPSRVAGVLYTSTLVGLAALTAQRMDRRLDRAGRFVWTALLTWAALGGRSLTSVASELAGSVERGELDDARHTVRSLVGRDPSGLDPDELCRAAVESVAENTTDAVVAPLVWGALAGPAGIAAYRAANTLDAMVGHRDTRHSLFGWASARLDDVLTWPAARLTAGLTVLLAPISGGDAHRTMRILRRDGASHPSPNAGRAEAAFAGALGVRLGGKNRYDETVEDRPSLGDGSRPGPEDIRRANRLSRAVGVASVVVCGVLAARLRR